MAQVKLCKTSQDCVPNVMSQCCKRAAHFPAEGDVLMKTAGKPLLFCGNAHFEAASMAERHFPMSDSYGNWAPKLYPLLSHIWILPTATKLIANNNAFTQQMHVPLTEFLVITFH